MAVYIRYDTEADALYVSFRMTEPGDAVLTRELDERRFVDFDAADQPIGLELLFVGDGINLDGVPRAEEIREALHSLGAMAAAA